MYQVRRVNHHHSLAYWADGNEIENLELLYLVANNAPDELERYPAEYETLFLATLIPAVFGNSRSISYAPSNATNGFISLSFTDKPYFEQRYENITHGIYGISEYYDYTCV